ncbi:ribonuclease T2-like [Mortierella sp. GBA30]|nr:ribonuclease T2-like [Mortierella sp. GBA30]
MMLYWSSYNPTPQQPDNNDFWNHEWNKHGTCLTTLGPDCGFKGDRDLYSYFNTTLALRKKYDIYAALKKAGITPRPKYGMEPRETDKYSVDAILTAIENEWNVKGAVYCKPGNPLEENGDSSTDLAAAEQTAVRARQAKATIDKHQSILFRIKLQDAVGKHVPVYEVANKTIGFFCSAGRYAVCQELSAIVDRFLEAHPDFALIYISLDNSEAAFNRTMEAHPRWLAVPFNEPIKTDILNEWQTKGVPCLHIYDPVEHEIVTSWGGSCLRFNFEHCFEEWKRGGHGVSYWQMVKGWWYYSAPVGVFRDITDEELGASGFPRLEQSAGNSGGPDPVETKKNK